MRPRVKKRILLVFLSAWIAFGAALSQTVMASSFSDQHPDVIAAVATGTNDRCEDEGRACAAPSMCLLHCASTPALLVHSNFDLNEKPTPLFTAPQAEGHAWQQGPDPHPPRADSAISA
jgi:hypothetical protein